MQADGVEDAGDAEDGDGEKRSDSADIQVGKKERKITNQFNFSERASQTLNNRQNVRFSLANLGQSRPVCSTTRNKRVGFYRKISL